MDASERIETDPVIRHGVRVLLIYAAERVLLFVSEDDAGRPFWYPPGGGREAGESAEETARRELREETGLADLDLGPKIGWRRDLASWGGVAYDCRERWFLARAPAFDVDTAGFTELERGEILAHRWWTVAELAGAADRPVPEDLAEVVRRLLRDGAPARPVPLGR